MVCKPHKYWICGENFDSIRSTTFRTVSATKILEQSDSACVCLLATKIPTYLRRPASQAWAWAGLGLTDTYLLTNEPMGLAWAWACYELNNKNKQTRIKE